MVVYKFRFGGRDGRPGFRTVAQANSDEDATEVYQEWKRLHGIESWPDPPPRIAIERMAHSCSFGTDCLDCEHHDECPFVGPTYGTGRVVREPLFELEDDEDQGRLRRREIVDGSRELGGDPPRRDPLPPSRSAPNFSGNAVQEESGPLACHLGPEAARFNETALVVAVNGTLLIARTPEQLIEAMASIPEGVDYEVYDLADLARGNVLKTTRVGASGDLEADDGPSSSASRGALPGQPCRLVGEPGDKFSWQLEAPDGSREQIVDNETIEVATVAGWVRGAIRGLGMGGPPWLELSLIPAPPLGGPALPAKLFLPTHQVVVRFPPSRLVHPDANVGAGGPLVPPPGSPLRQRPEPLPLSKRVPARKRTRKAYKLPFTSRQS